MLLGVMPRHSGRVKEPCERDVRGWTEGRHSLSVLHMYDEVLECVSFGV